MLSIIECRRTGSLQNDRSLRVQKTRLSVTKIDLLTIPPDTLPGVFLLSLTLLLSLLCAATQLLDDDPILRRYHIRRLRMTYELIITKG